MLFSKIFLQHIRERGVNFDATTKLIAAYLIKFVFLHINKKIIRFFGLIIYREKNFNFSATNTTIFLQY